MIFRVQPILLLALVAMSPSSFAQEFEQQPWAWRAAARLDFARYDSCAVSLSEGRVLIAGGTGISGPLESAELYLREGSFVPAARLLKARVRPTCTTLKDGRVLAAGGDIDDRHTAEVYDPGTNEWSVAFDHGQARGYHTATLLADGRVLLIGGRSAGGPLAEMALFEPTTGAWRFSADTLRHARAAHSASLLEDGKVLIVGGEDQDGVLASAEIYDPETDAIVAELPLPGPRSEHSATELLDGRILIAGGSDGQAELSSAVLFVPSEEPSFQLLEAAMQSARRAHLAMRVEGNGAVLFAGGVAADRPLAATEIFEPWSETFSPVGSLLAPRRQLTGAMLDDGSVLAMGGLNLDGPNGGCGIIISPTLRFSQSQYLNGQVAVASGASYGTGTVAFRLSHRVLSLTLSDNSRLLTTSRSVIGSLPATGIMNVLLTDATRTYLLTATAPSGLTAQASFQAKVRTSLTVAPQFTSTLSGQPVRVNFTLNSDEPATAFSGTVTTAVSTARTSTAVSATAPVSAPANVCCLTTLGSFPVTAAYSGSARFSAASATATLSHTIVTNVPELSMANFGGTLKLLSKGLVEVFLRPVAGPGGAPTPTGSVTLAKEGAALATLALQPPSVGVRSSARLAYTPSFNDRRSASGACFDVSYPGDTVYTAKSGRFCFPVEAAPSSLLFSAGGTNYTFGSPTTLTATLIFNDQIGIVSRNVTVSVPSQPDRGLPTTLNITLVPDATGRGVATGSAAVILPFNLSQGVLAARYEASGDLASVSSPPLSLTMNPIPTSLTFVEPTGSVVSNPFSISASLRAGAILPSGISPGGTIEFRDGTLTLGTVPVSAFAMSTSIGDGTSNTILVGELPISARIRDISRPAGSRSLQAIYSGNALFLPSSAAPKVVTVQ